MDIKKNEVSIMEYKEFAKYYDKFYQNKNGTFNIAVLSVANIFGFT